MAFLIGLAALAAMVIPAQAQQSPMVQCQIGNWSEVMPSYACDGFNAGSRLLTRSPNSVKDCAIEVGRHTNINWGSLLTPCTQIWNSKLIQAQCEAHPSRACQVTGYQQ